MKNTSRASPKRQVDPCQAADSVATEVRKRLRESRYAQLDAIECIVKDDEIVLVGEVTSFYLKQVAQTVAKQVGGVERIDNRLRVGNRKSH